MAVKLIIPGADFSAFGLPKVEDRLFGFPSLNLQALYLAEDGAVGSTPSQFTDSSGNNNHAPILTNASVQKTAVGVTSAFTGALFTGSTSGNVLTVSTIVFGTIEVGKALIGSGVINSPVVASQLTGTPGGVGTYQLNVSTATLSTQDFILRNNGFFGRTPFKIDSSFSLVMVTRNQVPATTVGASGRYPNLYYAAAAASGGGLSMTEGFSDGFRPTAGSFYVNHDNTTASNVAELGVLNRKQADGSLPWTGFSSIRAQKSNSGFVRATWIATAVSMDLATGVTRFRSFGSTSLSTDPTSVSTWINAVKSGGHLFGFGPYSGGNMYAGDFGLAGFYAGSKTDDELDVLITAAKNRMLLRPGMSSAIIM